MTKEEACAKFAEMVARAPLIAADEARRWRLNGIEVPEVEGCVDIDLNFSPSTNLLPIRRLRLNIGDEVAATAAWLRFPDFKLEPLDQSYRRISSAGYRYEFGAGSFVAQLSVNEAGFVTGYPNLWAPPRPPDEAPRHLRANLLTLIVNRALCRAAVLRCRMPFLTDLSIIETVSA